MLTLIVLTVYPIIAQEKVSIDPFFFEENYKTRLSITHSIGSLLKEYLLYSNLDVLAPLNRERYFIPCYDFAQDGIREEGASYSMIDFLFFFKAPFFGKWIPGLLLYAKQDSLNLVLGGNFKYFEMYMGFFLEYYQLFRITLGSYTTKAPLIKQHVTSGEYYMAHPEDTEEQLPIENLEAELSLFNFSLKSLVDFEIMEVLYFAASYGFELFDFDMDSFLYYYNQLQKFRGSLSFHHQIPQTGISYGGGLVLSSGMPFIDSAYFQGTLPLNELFFLRGGLSYLIKRDDIENLFGFSIEAAYNYRDTSNNNYLSIGLSQNYSQDLEKWPIPGDLNFHFKIYSAFSLKEFGFNFDDD